VFNKRLFLFRGPFSARSHYQEKTSFLKKFPLYGIVRFARSCGNFGLSRLSGAGERIKATVLGTFREQRSTTPALRFCNKKTCYSKK
jgi:hypothetical protein